MAVYVAVHLALYVALYVAEYVAVYVAVDVAVYMAVYVAVHVAVHVAASSAPRVSSGCCGTSQPLRSSPRCSLPRDWLGKRGCQESRTWCSWAKAACTAGVARLDIYCGDAVGKRD